jgi:hypothetical protein
MPTALPFRSRTRAIAAGPVQAIPYTSPTDIVKHTITYLLTPIATADLGLSLEESCRKHAFEVDSLFTGFQRTGGRVLEGANGAIVRLDYAGVLGTQMGAQPAVGLCAVTRRRVYSLILTLVSLREVAGQHDDDALALLDALTIDVKEKDPDAERGICGQWVIPSKTGSSLEYYTFEPDGTYVYRFESSHTGHLRNSLGETTASWGTASQDDDAGRWEVRGDLLVLAGRRGERIHVFVLGHDGRRATLRIGAATYVR